MIWRTHINALSFCALCCLSKRIVGQNSQTSTAFQINSMVWCTELDSCEIQSEIISVSNDIISLQNFAVHNDRAFDSSIFFLLIFGLFFFFLTSFVYWFSPCDLNDYKVRASDVLWPKGDNTDTTVWTQLLLEHKLHTYVFGFVWWKLPSSIGLHGVQRKFF